MSTFICKFPSQQTSNFHFKINNVLRHRIYTTSILTVLYFLLNCSGLFTSVSSFIGSLGVTSRTSISTYEYPFLLKSYFADPFLDINRRYKLQTTARAIPTTTIPKEKEIKAITIKSTLIDQRTLDSLVTYMSPS